LQRSSLEAGSILAGRYRVERLIGEGGMGEVYLATHLVIDKPVAVKVLAPEQMRRDRTVTRFLQEAKAASKIRHPNVVDITDFGESDGCAFFVMEYLEGEDLDHLLKREGRISWERTRAILVQLLEALGAAHRAGVVHRDIKPHNCFITPSPHGDEVVKVIDFGIAKLRIEGSEEQLTRTGAIMGTAEYMSPEQGLGQDIDGRSDLYSVGVILYRMLTGTVPYLGPNPMAILYQHIHGEIPSPSAAAPEAGISPGVQALMRRALAKDRDMRFASAEAFIEALHAADDAPALSAARRTRKWALAGIGGVLLVGGLAWLGTRDSTVPQTELAQPSPAANVAGSAIAPDATATPDANISGAASANERMATEAVRADDRPTNGDDDVTADTPAVNVEGDDDDDPTQDDDPADDEAAPPSSAASPTGPPVRRSARALRSALSKIAGKVGTCGKKAGLFPGEKVRVEIRIGTDGKVDTAEIVGSFSKAGATCIENAVRTARFGPAARPQTYVHTFDL
jgi:eukaryotic-like serine/threonine-protein kinase